MQAIEEFHTNTNRFVRNHFQQGIQSIFNRSCFLSTEQHSIVCQKPFTPDEGKITPAISDRTITDDIDHTIGFMVVDVGIIFESIFDARPCNSRIIHYLVDDTWQKGVLESINRACDPEAIYFGCLQHYRKLIVIMADWTCRFENEGDAKTSLDSHFLNNRRIKSALKIINVHEMRSFSIKDHDNDAADLLKKIIDLECLDQNACSYYNECLKRDCRMT